MVKVLDYGLEVSEFELQLHLYIRSRINSYEKGMNQFTLPLAID